jgi:hypothetical protein
MTATVVVATVVVVAVAAVVAVVVAVEPQVAPPAQAGMAREAEAVWALMLPAPATPSSSPAPCRLQERAWGSYC